MIDTTNEWMVAARGEDIVIVNPPAPYLPLSRRDALRYAAWIVAIADLDDEFPAILKAIQNT